ncbi:membrane-associated Zn-dependent protease 1 [Citrobacter werkmanii]|uniref:membrane-associated Zn-dependent protease 1 n=1 Tax=Citrobacter werkmanii TaxID=67827 RepID=UPI00264A51BC|nr:membrane-associated Zn-dependent protease 1 [Citrobacter werkmanii]MDN8559329.1 membrane-associated Zn-dependent protease 1 [Citrobacter werkmanii]
MNKMKVLFCGLLAFATAMPCAQAAGEAHLLFHMGVGAQGKFAVGGTVQNKGDAPVTSGYVVILPVDEKCNPMTPVMQTFGPLAPGQKTQFNIPVSNKLSAYHIGSFAAFDDEGFALKTTDETASIIAGREPAERKKCESRRSGESAKAPTQP